MGYVGFDCGTYNLVSASRNDKKDIEFKRELNAFIELPLENRFMFNMMKASGVKLIERDKVAYAVGEAAREMCLSMSQIELRRPMKDGCVNPKEKDAYKILQIMIHSLIGEVADGTVLYYSVPANAVNQETDADYHQKILEGIFKSYNVNGKRLKAFPINEALALVFAELGHKAYTGIGVSCLCPGTTVYTDKGIANIEDVKVGDKVITHKGRWSTIFNVIKKNFKGLQTKLQIKGYVNNTESYKFVDNHQVYIKRENNWQWVGCEDLKVGDIVGEPIVYENKELDKHTMTICERTTCGPYIKKQYGVTQNLQRLIGYFMGDGSVNDTEGCIQFDFSTNERDNIDDVKTILQLIFEKPSSEVNKSENCIRVKCYSKGLCSWFKNHCYDENKQKKYPWDLQRIGYGDAANLLAGLVRSDGWFNDETVSFGNTNTHLIWLTRQCFARLGIATSLCQREPREHYYEKDERWIIGLKDEWSVETGSKLSLTSIKDFISNVNCDNNLISNKLWIEDGFICGKIQAIEYDEYEGEVYDLQVEEDYSFSGPMLTIKNCGAGMVNVCYSIYSAPVFQFSLVNSGDWIDKMAAKATGESPVFINKEKHNIDLEKTPSSLVERAIQTQYRLMIEKTVRGIKEGIEIAGNKARSENPIDVIVAGGTAGPKGFDKLFREVLKEAELPIKIGEIKRPEDYLYAVAKGCLIAAENSAA